MKRLVFLCLELAGYMVNCINTLATDTDSKIDLIAYPVNPEAPFQFDFHANITVHSRTDMSLSDLQGLIDAQPTDFIYCSGWSDKEYIKLVRQNKHIRSLLGFDNQWEGNAKQWLASGYSRLFLAPIFDYAFVPGPPQRLFAQKLGFANAAIFEGAYSCDYALFSGHYERDKATKEKQLPKRLIYVGRYLEHKGIFDLFESFTQLVADGYSDWELHCLGTGALWDQRPEHPNIVHHGFVQPTDFEDHIKNTSVFVLPSHFEPWGVVVHEFATAGFPLVLSDKIGAASRFLDNGKNGVSFQSGNRPDLKRALEVIMRASQAELWAMGTHSRTLAATITPQKWAQSVFRMANGEPSI